jgi:hypothetical protein
VVGGHDSERLFQYIGRRWARYREGREIGRDVHELYVIREEVHVECYGEPSCQPRGRDQRVSGALRGRERDQIELVLGLALGGQQQVAVALVGLEALDVVRQQAVQKRRGVRSLDSKASAGRLVEQERTLHPGPVFGRNVPVGEQGGRAGRWVRHPGAGGQMDREQGGVVHVAGIVRVVAERGNRHCIV